MPFSSSLAVSEPPNSVNSKRLNIHFPISLWQILKHLQKTTFFMSLKTWLVFNIVRIKCRKLIYYMLSLVVYPWVKIQFHLDYELLEGRPYLAVYFNGRDMFHSVMAFWTLPRLTLCQRSRYQMKQSWPLLLRASQSLVLLYLGKLSSLTLMEAPERARGTARPKRVAKVADQAIGAVTLQSLRQCKSHTNYSHSLFGLQSWRPFHLSYPVLNA